MLFGFLVAAVLLGGGLLWWSTQGPPPGDPNLVDPANVYPVSLPAGYAPPIELDEAGQFSTITGAGGEFSASSKEIPTDGTVSGRGAVSICVIPPGDSEANCGTRRVASVRVETRYKNTRVLISALNPRVTNLDEWRGVAFTSDYSKMTWLTSQAK